MAVVIKSIVVIIAVMFTPSGEKVKPEEVSTPLVPKHSHEKSEVSELKRRLSAMAAIKQFARVFSIIKAKKKQVTVEIIAERIIPAKEEPVAVVNANVRKPQKVIRPSIKMARQPVYSLNKAPTAARRSGHEKPKKLIMLFSSYCN